MRTLRVASLVVVASIFLSGVGSAQQVSGSIAGVVRDTSGGVLPGVTVEASSPALIEKVRTAVTDDQGLFRIVDLRPGPYVVTFTLTGFSTLRREGIDLSVGFAAQINADLSVGALEESITVSGQAPLVDLQNVQQQTTVSRSTLDSLPTTRRVAQLVTLIPGANTGSTTFHDVGGVGSDRGEFAVHGQRTGDMTYNFGGVDSRVQSGGSFPYNVHLFQELVVETAAGSAESTTGGVQVNIVPKDGGNTFSGSFSTEFTNPSMQNDNINDDLRAAGLTTAPSVRMYRDIGGGLGGPIFKDKLWFFGANRWLDRGQYMAGNFYNLRPNTLFFQADNNSPGWTHDYSTDYSLRLTWQPAQKHRLAVQHSQHPSCQCTFGLLENTNPFLSPEAAGEHHYDPQYMPIAMYTFPATNRLLFEVTGSMNMYARHQKRQYQAADAVTDVMTIPVIDIGGPNLNYGSRQGGYQLLNDIRYHEKVGFSYVTGSHNFKAGVDLNQFRNGREEYTDINLISQGKSYEFRDQSPTALWIHATPNGTYNKATENAVYAQDQVTIQRVTVNLGLRYSVYDAFIPEAHLAAGYFVPQRDLPSKERSPHWSNLSPRLGAAYDLFGSGRTALKASLGRYPARNTGTAVDYPISNLAASTKRNWNDNTFGPGDPRSGNFVPDCDLLNSASHGECGAWSDLTFGQIREPSTRRADDAREGYNLQSYNWQSSVSIQHEIRQGLAVNVGYFRTWYGAFLATDNLAWEPADFDEYCITAPVDDRLGASSGQRFCNLYDIKPNKFGRTDNLVTQASHYGNQAEVFNGIDVTVNWRFGDGGTVQGGYSTGKTTQDSCFTVDSPQAERPGFCDVTRPWGAASDAKFSVVYPIVWDISASAIYQNSPGFPIAASYVATNAEVKQSLERDLGSCRGAATCNGTATIDLIPANTMFGDRIRQLDLRFARIFRFGPKTRVRGNFDIYNIFNASTVLNENTRYGNDWRAPRQVMGGRLFKVSGSLDF